MKNKAYIVSIISALIALLVCIFLVYPILRGIKKNSESWVDFKKELISLQDKIKSVQEFKADMRDLQPDLEKIDKLLIDSGLPIDFIKFLEKTSEDSGISVEITSATLPLVEEQTWPSLAFQLSLNGSFPSFLKFLERTEAGPYLIEIQNMNIRKTKEEIANAKKVAQIKERIAANLIIKVFAK